MKLPTADSPTRKANPARSPPSRRPNASRRTSARPRPSNADPFDRFAPRAMLERARAARADELALARSLVSRRTVEAARSRLANSRPDG
ncbi:MAG TPA: hypothetical protein VEZ40_15870 [Pyrinomonadaceae bacterium]|nr:hypothetical protein [Pyrinomonadaceae bacterium]